jgi:hypothetical protein
MKVLTTVLKVKPITTAEAVIGAVVDFVRSNDSTAGNILKEVDITHDFDCPLGKDSIRCIHIADEQVSAVRYQTHIGASVIWTIDVVYKEEADKKAIFIEIDGTAKYYVSKGAQKQRLRLLQLFAERGLLADDDLFKINGKAILADVGNLDYIAKLINGEIATELPIVYASTVSGCLGYEIGAAELARDLCGIAHVIEEKDNTIAYELKEKTNGKNPYNGYVGLFVKERASKMLRNATNNQSGFEERVFDEAQSARAQQVDGMRLSGRLDIPDFDCVAHRFEQDMAVNAEAERFAGNFDSENVRLKDENKRFQVRNNELEQENRDVKAECLQYKEAFNQNRGDKGNLIAPANASDSIAEFFVGEQSDLIITILESALRDVDKEHRDYELLTAILAKNKIKGNGLKMLDELKQVFKDGERIGEREMTQLKRLGFELVSDNTHYKMVYKGNPKYCFTLEKTPSDYRYTGNIVSDITKKLSVYKKR